MTEHDRPAPTDQLLGRARDGDRDAFEALVAPHRRELLVHCYRMLGSYQDAEDALQETLLAAWVGLAAFEGRSSVRTWLYRVATNRALNHRRASARRVRRETSDAARSAAVASTAPSPTGRNEVVWLQPFPQAGLDHVGDTVPGPDALYERKEAVSLALVRLLQLLPAQQRAVLLLRDVLGFRARETAELLDVTEDSANAALKRARATLALQDAQPGSLAETDLPDDGGFHDRFVDAFLNGEVADLVALFSDEVWLRMPPLTLEYHGREAAARFFEAIAPMREAVVHLQPTAANFHRAWGEYADDPTEPVLHLTGVLVTETDGRAIASLTHFGPDVGCLLGLPRNLPTAGHPDRP